MKIKEIDLYQLNKLGYDDKLKDRQIIKDCTYNNYFIYDKVKDRFWSYDYEKKVKLKSWYGNYVENAKEQKIELIMEEK